MGRLRTRWNLGGLAAWLVWAAMAAPASAQNSEAGWGKWLDFSSLNPNSDRAGNSGLLGEAVPPAVLLLDMSVPPGLVGSVPFGDAPMYAPRSRVTNQPGATMTMFRQDGSIGAPLFQTERDTVIGYVDFRNVSFNTNAYLVDSHRFMPNDLWDATVGFNYTHKTNNDWIVGGGLSVGSPSDRPYQSTRVVFPSFNAFARIPAEKEGDAWLASVTWVPVSLIRFPLPGLAYEWNASEKLQIVAGVPFSIVWKPHENLRFDLGYMPPYQTRAQWTWHTCKWVDAFIGFESVADTYMLADRVHRRDLFYAYEKRAPIGLRFNLHEHAVLDIAGGYLFDRVYFSSHSFVDESRDRLHIAPSAFGMIRFALTF